MVPVTEVAYFFQVFSVFIAPGEVGKDVFNSMNTETSKNFGAGRSDSFYILDRGILSYLLTGIRNPSSRNFISPPVHPQRVGPLRLFEFHSGAHR